MSHHLAVCGIAAPDGLYARCGDGWRKLEPTREPMAARLTANGLVRCPHCDESKCDCQDWLEWMLLAEPLPQECIGDVA